MTQQEPAQPERIPAWALYETGIPPLMNIVPQTDVAKEDVLVTHYDTYSCEHWVVGGGGSSTEGFNGDIPIVEDFVCEGDIITTVTNTLSFSNGLLVSTG